MFDLSIKFKTFSNLLIFLLLLLANSLWIYRCLKNKSRFSLTPFILANLLLFITWGRLLGLDPDETEHLHCAWMVSQGLIPFKDFWQHHSPFLWIILAPFFKILKPTVLILEMSRLFSALIFTSISFVGWQIAKRVWQKEAKISVYLLMLFSASILSEFLLLRPDLFLELFLLLGLYFSLEISGRKISPLFFAGVSFALAVSFTPKQYLLVLLPVIVIFLEKSKLILRKLLVYLTGLILGSFPFVFYLIKKNILNEFIFWVFKFNQERITLLVFFPIAIAFMGAWGAYLLLTRYRKFKDSKSLILFIAFCLSTISSLTCTTFFPLSLGFWFILCAISSSGCDILVISGKISSLSKRSLILGFFFTLLIAPNFISARTHKGLYFSEDKKEVSKLIKYCAGDTCLVFLPLHPVFNYDATRLYSWWQYFDFLDKFLSVKKDARSKNIAQAIINLRPAVIVCKLEEREVLLDLFLKNLITKEDYKKLRSLFEENYTVKIIGKRGYYIRNDKL